MPARRFGGLLCPFALGILAGPAVHADSRIELGSGDRVVLLGGTLIEREQRFGYWETLLTALHAGSEVTFRNLGWSGDTVWGESRGMFEPHVGSERLLEQVRAANPTVVLIAYGNNEAFAGEAGIESFAARYRALLEDLDSGNRRFVLLSPLEMEAASVPGDLPAAARHAAAYNEQIERYAGVVERLAAERGHAFIDLRPDQRAELAAGRQLTANGLHLTDDGYRLSARWLARRFASATRAVAYDFDAPKALELRQAIMAKNELFFHRWRPQNFTYLFGFRQHEQGHNAAEVPRFDPLVAKAEQRIAAVAKLASIP